MGRLSFCGTNEGETPASGKRAQFASEQELRCKELAELLIEAECLSDQGQDKIAYIMQDSVYDEMDPGDLPVVNRFLKELGSTQQLEDE
jgi:hypothetical protein